MKIRLYFAVLISGIMSLLMSDWITFINIGITSDFLTLWAAWCVSWPIAGSGICIQPTYSKIKCLISKKEVIFKASMHFKNTLIFNKEAVQTNLSYLAQPAFLTN